MLATTPLVSVVLPTRDRLSLLPRALRSVLDQDVADFEVVVVDDGSRDGTVAWLRGLDDPRVVIVETPGGRGPSGARNDGIARARGRYVAFQDSDDEWLPGKLARQLASFERSPRPVLSFTGMYVERGGVRRAEVADVDGDGFERLLAYAGPITTPGLVVDRELAGDALVFDETMPAMVEHALVLRLSRRHPVARVADPLYVRHAHAGPQVTDPRRQIVGRYRILETWADELGDRPAVAAVHHWRLAAAFRRTDDDLAVGREIRRAAGLDPRVRFRVLAAAAALDPTALRLAWRVLDRLDRLLRRLRR